MLQKAKTTGPGKVVRFKRRQVRRNKRRPLEAVDQDFERWDIAAAALGLNWSEFARRAMNAASSGAVYGHGGAPQIVFAPPVSEKGGGKTAVPARKKVTGTRAGRKG